MLPKHHLKRLSIILSMLIVCSCYQRTKSKHKESPPEVTVIKSKSQLIEEINEEFKSINNDTPYYKVELNNEEFVEHIPDGGAQLTGFYKDGKLKKMVQWWGFSNNIQIVTFYFKNNDLIFVNEQFNAFRFDVETQMFNRDTLIITFEAIYYFNNQNVIEKLTKGDNLYDEDIDRGKQLLFESEKYRNILSRKL